jgi:hypothetical protein
MIDVQTLTRQMSAVASDVSNAVGVNATYSNDRTRGGRRSDRRYCAASVAPCWYLSTRTEKIRKRTDTVVAFTWRVLNIVSIGKHVS